MKVEIPFQKNLIMSLARGRKIATTRSKRYGKIGDHFSIGDSIKFKIVSISKEKLGDIAKFLYWEEGFSSPEEFKKFWLTIHRKWEPEKKYYLHIFKRNSEKDPLWRIH